MTSKFILDDSDEDGDLPFPEPLPRSAFLEPDFSPTELLSSLTSRHQTLFDLRTELSSRSQSIASELLTLVNNEYQAFLGLGQDLRGGGDKVDEVKVGLLGFQKGVGGIRDVVKERRRDADRLVREREEISRDIAYGRGLLLVAEKVDELEEVLVLGDKNTQNEDDWSDEEEDDESDRDSESGETGPLVNFARLRRLVHMYVTTRNQVDYLGGSSQPFLAKLSDRIQTIRQTLLIDLGTALKQAKELKAKGGPRVIKIMGLYSDMAEIAEALKVLKAIKK